jgi:hypothetical protein
MSLKEQDQLVLGEVPSRLIENGPWETLEQLGSKLRVLGEGAGSNRDRIRTTHKRLIFR